MIERIDPAETPNCKGFLALARPLLNVTDYGYVYLKLSVVRRKKDGQE